MTIKLTSSALTKNLARRTKLVQHLDRALNNWDGPFTFDYESKQGDDAWHPSGDCTPSVPKLYQKAIDSMAGVEYDPISAQLRKTFLVGHFWHQFLQHLVVEELGFATEVNIERRGSSLWGASTSDGKRRKVIAPNVAGAKPFNWATGSADIAPCQIPGYGDALVDFKTMNSMDFNRNYAPAWAVCKWEAQCNIYMDWFGLEKALIIGVEKDSPHNFKEFEFLRNQPLVDAIYNKWEYVGHFLDEGIRPNEDDDIPLPFIGVHE